MMRLTAPQSSFRKSSSPKLFAGAPSLSLRSLEGPLSAAEEAGIFAAGCYLPWFLHFRLSHFLAAIFCCENLDGEPCAKNRAPVPRFTVLVQVPAMTASLRPSGNPLYV